MGKIKDLAGQRFSSLLVLERKENTKANKARWACLCDCGTETVVIGAELLSGHTKSCGCLQKSNRIKHGLHNTRQYQIWTDMKTRCDNTNHKYYDYYGGRGITYCDKWKTFDGFWEDMRDSYKDDLTLNRRDNNGSYCKENCSWDTKHFQGHMRRKLEGTILKSIGVFLDQAAFKYRVRMKILEKPYSFGSYSTEEEAAKAYDDASEMYYGDRPNNTHKVDDFIFRKVKVYMENRGKDLRKYKVELDGEAKVGNNAAEIH